MKHVKEKHRINLLQGLVSSLSDVVPFFYPLFAICSADYYAILGVPRNATLDEIIVAQVQLGTVIANMIHILFSLLFNDVSFSNGFISFEISP